MSPRTEGHVLRVEKRLEINLSDVMEFISDLSLFQLVYGKV